MYTELARTECCNSHCASLLEHHAICAKYGGLKVQDQGAVLSKRVQGVWISGSVSVLRTLTSLRDGLSWIGKIRLKVREYIQRTSARFQAPLRCVVGVDNFEMSAVRLCDAWQLRQVKTRAYRRKGYSCRA